MINHIIQGGKALLFLAKIESFVRSLNAYMGDFSIGTSSRTDKIMTKNELALATFLPHGKHIGVGFGTRWSNEKTAGNVFLLQKFLGFQSGDVPVKET